MPKIIKEYTILYSTNIEELEEIVMKSLNEGWKCTGGAFTDENRYYQAMQRKISEEQISFNGRGSNIPEGYGDDGYIK